MQKEHTTRMGATDVIIACKMIEDEVNAAIEATGCTLPVVWGDAGLHEFPEKLRAKLNEMIAEHAGAENILLAYNLCGNGMIGVGSATSNLVLPRFDDCVWMALCLQQGEAPQMDCRSLYYTRGWLEGDSMFTTNMARTYEKYGPDKGRKVYRAMFKHYESVTLLDTGAYPLHESEPRVEELAEELGLKVREQKGSTRVLQRLFSGNWQDEIIVLPPGKVFDPTHFSKEQAG